MNKTNTVGGVVALGLVGALLIISGVTPLSGGEDTVETAFQGFGADTRGGQDGRVVVVTTLDDAGEGSLRWALEDLDEARIVQFDVAGTIELEKQIQVNGDVTVLGQSAPGAITISGDRLRVIGSNVILQGLRVRPGDGPGGPFDNRDAISIGKTGVEIENIVIDGNSLSWAVDENLSVWGDVKNVTISHNIIAHSLDELKHPKGGHGMGMVIGGGGIAQVSIIGNVFANNQNRNPLIKDSSQQIEFLNNLVFNWGENGLTADSSNVHVQGNVFVAGADSVDRPPILLGTEDAESSTYYIADNIGNNRGDGVISPTHTFAPSVTNLVPTDAVFDHVLSRAGARTPTLDGVDAALIAGIRDGSGRVINAVSDLTLDRPADEPTSETN